MIIESEKISPKLPWLTIASTILSGLFLAVATYIFGVVAALIFADKIEVYFVERPPSASKKFEKLVVIDNYSTSIVEDMQFTIVAVNATLSDFVNLGGLEQSAPAPQTLLVKISRLLPNRQASFLLTSDVFVPEDSFRLAKGPAGIRFKSKSRLVDSLVDWSQLQNAGIQFLIYVAGLLFFERRLGQLKSLANELKIDIQNKDDAIKRIERSNIKMKLTHFRRALSQGRENRLWREVALGAFEQTAGNRDAAKKMLNLILVKARITPVKSIDDLDEEEIVQSIEDAKTMLSSLGPS